MKQIVLIAAYFICLFKVSFSLSEKNEETSNALKNLQDEVKNLIVDLLKHQAQIGHEFKAQLTQVTKRILEEFEKTTETTLKNIEDESRKSKKESTVVDICQKGASDKLNIIFHNVTDVMNLCQMRAILLDYPAIQNVIDFTVQVGNELVKKVDSIIGNCVFFGHDPSTVDECITPNIPGVEILVNNYQNLVKDGKNFDNDVSTKGVLKTSTSAMKARSTLKNQMIKIKNEAVQCLGL